MRLGVWAVMGSSIEGSLARKSSKGISSIVESKAGAFDPLRVFAQSAVPEAAAAAVLEWRAPFLEGRRKIHSIRMGPETACGRPLHREG